LSAGGDDNRLGRAAAVLRERSTFERWFPALANDKVDRVIQGAAA